MIYCEIIRVYLITRTASLLLRLNKRQQQSLSQNKNHVSFGSSAYCRNKFILTQLASIPLPLTFHMVVKSFQYPNVTVRGKPHQLTRRMFCNRFSPYFLIFFCFLCHGSAVSSEFHIIASCTGKELICHSNPSLKHSTFKRRGGLLDDLQNYRRQALE